jgi:AcrR family transcriptional regulator
VLNHLGVVKDMASKDRILRLKEETRTNILAAALKIVKVEGWQALSMRKIADEIEYTAPIIYEYFSNKEAILMELTRQGFLILSEHLDKAKAKHRLPGKQLEAMWMAYWNFAFAEQEYYQLMFGVEMNCCHLQKSFQEAELLYSHISEAIEALMDGKNPSEDEICKWYYTFWSVVHGLISINIVRKGASDSINKKVLSIAIEGIIRTISA